MYYKRLLKAEIIRGLQTNPAVAIIGPRQVGKTSLAKDIIGEMDVNSIYLDLEKPSDLLKLDNAEWFLSQQKGKLICLDEIQRKPEIFPLIRSLVDEWRGNSHFLILGSASRELIMQSSESLAGRISYKQLTPFLFNEIGQDIKLEDYLVKGGFPRSILPDNNVSMEWRLDFITTFLERDLLFWSGFSTQTMRKLWQMTAHLNGQTINYNMLSLSLNVSNVTCRNYIELLASTFMLNLLPPYEANLKKRIVKSPKIYLNDTGITNSLLGIRNFESLAGSPALGGIWELAVYSNLKGHFPRAMFYFYRTSNGAEIDIVMEYLNKRFAIECKAGQQPSLGRGNWNAIEDINPDYVFVVAPVKEGWPMKEKVDVVNIPELINSIEKNL
ncbi:MAG: ATP-binding protein [Bacteroidales bacterium]|nr:ATP-binding protein [Bacteroidales bacterium]